MAHRSDSRSFEPTARLRARLLRELLPAIPLATVIACSGSDPVGEEAGVTTRFGAATDTGDDDFAGTQETDDDADTSSSGTTDDGTSTSTSTSTTGEEACFDAFPVTAERFSVAGCPELPGQYEQPEMFAMCVEADPGTDCAQSCGETCGDPWTCPGVAIGDNLQFCGPYFDEQVGMCCSLVISDFWEPEDSWGVEGRPFRPSGATRVAATRLGQARSGAADPELDPETRDHLARHWRRVALAEHASVASFARFVAQLQSLGAPPDLVVEALRAAADETRHARSAFALASRFAGRPVAPGPLETRDGLHGVDDLAAAVCDAAREGCVEETLSAHEIALLAREATDPGVRSVLETVAEDEARHAALAWRFVDWALTRHPELRREVEAVFIEARIPPVDRAARTSGDAHLAFGCADRPTRAAWRRRGLDEVVRPCARALLSSASTREHAPA